MRHTTLVIDQTLLDIWFNFDGFVEIVDILSGEGSIGQFLADWAYNACVKKATDVACTPQEEISLALDPTPF